MISGRALSSVLPVKAASIFAACRSSLPGYLPDKTR
jgi:hypothetical protein